MSWQKLFAVFALVVSAAGVAGCAGVLERPLAVFERSHPSRGDGVKSLVQHKQHQETTKRFAGQPGEHKASQSQTAHHRKGVMAAKQGNFAEAHRHFRTAITAGRPSAALLNDIGYAFYLEDRLDKAEQSFRNALKVDAQFVPARNNLGLVLSERGQFQQAGTQGQAQSEVSSNDGRRFGFAESRGKSRQGGRTSHADTESQFEGTGEPQMVSVSQTRLRQTTNYPQAQPHGQFGTRYEMATAKNMRLQPPQVEVPSVAAHSFSVTRWPPTTSGSTPAEIPLPSSNGYRPDRTASEMEPESQPLDANTREAIELFGEHQEPQDGATFASDTAPPAGDLVDEVRELTAPADESPDVLVQSRDDGQLMDSPEANDRPKRRRVEVIRTGLTRPAESRPDTVPLSRGLRRRLAE